MCTPEVLTFISDQDHQSRTSIVLCGVEAHICVQQTALDLITRGYSVHLIVDGIASQRPIDSDVAIRRMEAVGVCLTTCESLLYELMRDSTHSKFRSILQLAKSHVKTKPEKNELVS